MPKPASTRPAYKMLTCIYLCRTLLFFAPYADFFGKNVLVVFNKGKETVSLKLDLPEMKREENFSSLFGNRFSYDNSKIILDVPAYGVEIIYN